MDKRWKGKYLYEEAITLKKQGVYYKHIIDILGITKATFFRWVKKPPKYITGEPRKRHWWNRTSPEYSDEERKLIALGIDFEGCIGLYKHASKNSHHYIPSVDVVSTTQPLLNYWMSIVKIGHISRGNRSKNKDWKDLHHWRINAKGEVLGFLKQIKKYLIIKQKQAQLLIDAIEERIPNELARKQLHQLNSRGHISLRC